MNPVRDKNFSSSGQHFAGVSNGMKRWGVGCILILAFCGLADSAYLAEHETNGTPIICNIQNLSGCNVVASSQYSKVFGIPVADFGVLFYSIMFVLVALELALFDRFLRRLLQAFAIMGILFSVFSTLLQVFVIKALCVYCLASALITVIILILATLIEPIPRIIRRNNTAPQLSTPASPKATQGAAPTSLRMPPAP